MTNQNIKLNLLEQTVQLPKAGQVPIRMDKKQRRKPDDKRTERGQ